MAIDVTIGDVLPNDVMEMVRELRRQKLVQGKDFDFKYITPTYDYLSNSGTSRHTVFTFYNEKYATFFALKYSNVLKQ